MNYVWGVHRGVWCARVGWPIMVHSKSSSKIWSSHVCVYNTAMGLTRFPLSDFRGGWNIRDNPAQLQPNETPRTQNTILTPIGQLSQRKGMERWDRPENTITGPIYNMRRWIVAKGEVTNLLMVSGNGTVWSLDSTGRATRRFTGTAGTIWSFEPMRNLATSRDILWMVNGVDPPQRWDGATAETRAWSSPPPTACIIVKSWKNLMCVAGDSAQPYRLYFSRIGEPESSISTQFVDIGTVDDDQDPIMDLNILGDHLIVLKRNSVWAVFDPTSFINRRLGSPGCEGRFQSSSLKNKLYFFNRYGIHSVDLGGSIEHEAEQIRPVFSGENEPIDVLNQAQLAKARILGNPSSDRVLISVPVNGENENNRLYELIPSINFRRLGGRRFVVLPAIMRQIMFTSSLVLFTPNAIYVSVRTERKIYVLFSGTHEFDGSAISAQWISSWRGIQEEEPIERIRRVDVEFSGELTIDVYSDFNLNSPRFSSRLVPLSVESDSLWDGGPWDGGSWDSVGGSSFGRVRPETRARYHAIGFRNNVLDRGFQVYSGEIVYRGGKEH